MGLRHDRGVNAGVVFPATLFPNFQLWFVKKEINRNGVDGLSTIVRAGSEWLILYIWYYSVLFLKYGSWKSSDFMIKAGRILIMLYASVHNFSTFEIIFLILVFKHLI